MAYLTGPEPATGVPRGSLDWMPVDPGIPLAQAAGLATDPLAMWKSQPSIRKVVGYVARQVAQLPWHAYERISDADRQRLKGSDVERLMARPSRFVGGFDLIRDLVTDAMLYDRFCAVLDSDGQLIRLSPKRWRITGDYWGRVTRITLLAPRGHDPIDITDAPLMIGWGWSDDAPGGVSPMFTLATILDEANESVKWRKRQWAERPQFQGYLKHPASFKTEEQKQRFSVSWGRWSDGAHGTPILEDGMDYVASPAISPKDALDLEGRQLTDVEVAAAFHIPPELVGARPGNYSNMQAFRSMLFGPTLGPLITQLQQAANRIVPVVDDREGVYLEMSREAAINGSMMEQAQILQTMVGGPYMLRSEARARFNLPFVDGTEELIVPLNVLEGGQASPRDSGSQNRDLTTGAARKAIAKNDEPEEDEEADRERDLMVAEIRAWLATVQNEIGELAVTEAEIVERYGDSAAAALLPGLIRAARLAAHRVAEEADNADWDDAVMDAYLKEMAKTKGEQVAVGTARHLEEAEHRSLAWELLTVAAATWAATAVTDALGFGGTDAARHSGMGTKTWRVTSRNPRNSHARLNGQTVAVDEKFSNGARWPGDAILSADESAGCRCTVVFNRN
ncbi:MAG: phage portal protein [Propionibacteriaceae bacterium]|nr:phage portal protein [Propionibacteriaceae bacterium]